MPTEMDLFRMDERQRLAWLMANRGTVIAIGLAWIGMIVWELAHQREPLFLIAMVPVFALVRVGLFFYYGATPSDGSVRAGHHKLGTAVKIAAAALLSISLLLPLYGLDEGLGSERTRGYTWEIILDDWPAVFPLAFAFLWPVPVLLLSRRKSGSRITILAQLAEPVLAALSTLIILWIPQLMWEYRQVFWFIFVPLSARPDIGCYLAVVANGVYVVGWLSELLQPDPLGPGPE